jgi:outer membrane protein TolC
VDSNGAALQVNTLKSDFESSLLQLNAQLNQNTSDRIILTSALNYTPMKLTFTDAFNWFKDRAPAMRGAKLSQQLAQGALEIAEKNQMPLPTVSFSGVSVSYGNRYAGGYTTYTGAGSQGAGNIDIEATVNLTLPILGPGGFFGLDTLRLARINVDRSDTQMQQTLINNELQIRANVFQLQQLEDRLKTQKENLIASSSLLEKTITDLTSQKTNRLELRDALDRARNNEIEYLQNIYAYIQQKNSFYELIGKDWEPE